MLDLLVTVAPEALHSTVQEVVLLEQPSASDIFETEVENVLTEVVAGHELLTVEQINVLLTEGVQGPPGAGVPGTGGIERTLLVDASRPVAYAAFADRIVRLDYSTQWPPAEAAHATDAPEADWPNRTSLTYT